MIIKYKKIVIIVFAMIVMLCINACGYKERFTEKIFCDYYESATYFEELQPLICEYLNTIDVSYEKSDKSSFETFYYNKEVLEELYDEIESYENKIINAENPNTDENLANLGLIYFCAKIKGDIAEKDLNKTIGISSNKEWFEKIKNDLDESYNDLCNHVEK